MYSVRHSAANKSTVLTSDVVPLVYANACCDKHAIFCNDVYNLLLVQYHLSPTELMYSFFTGSTALVDPRGSFSFMVIFTDGRNPWTSDKLVARPLPKHRTTQTQNKRIHTHTHTHTPNIHILSGIRTHDLSVGASEDSSYLRPLRYCDRLMYSY
jgi:hypothetical protein